MTNRDNSREKGRRTKVSEIPKVLPFLHLCIEEDAFRAGDTHAVDRVILFCNEVGWPVPSWVLPELAYRSRLKFGLTKKPRGRHSNFDQVTRLAVYAAVKAARSNFYKGEEMLHVANEILREHGYRGFQSDRSEYIKLTYYKMKRRKIEPPRTLVERFDIFLNCDKFTRSRWYRKD